ncbi:MULTISPECIES: AAA family ATPase [Arthrobacter]|uniref:Nucleoside kinase n=1 Tax=Arthrobacter terricola TaxID=2547396 RepID=A0A4R5K824_9MICC|nr:MULTISPECIES: AAA family ATPase [Arthrobacter]MBT8163479.1 AAA family ATPase [Arthrobacter sp. GN70]TDF89475.1 nucleoside kinase [Arthrobacter terricola]
MGRRNFLIEGGSGTGKTSVCEELARRGYHVVHGDRELAYQGDPETGAPMEDVTGLAVHDDHLWRVDKVKALVADQRQAVTFFCGGSRKFAKFIDLFNGVFVLEVDTETLVRRLDDRREDEWGGQRRQAELDLILRLHRTKADIPRGGIAIDATGPLAHVVDEILTLSGAVGQSAR